MSPSEITFRAFSERDLPLVAAWLQEPGLRQWFPDEDYIEDLEDHLADPWIWQWLVCRAGRPLAYLQSYRIDAFDADHPLAALPPGALGLDTFIARAEDRNRGLGRRYLALWAQGAFLRGVPALGIDPSPVNAPALRAYAALGFRPFGAERATPWGPVQPMSLWPADLVVP